MGSGVAGACGLDGVPRMKLLSDLVRQLHPHLPRVPDAGDLRIGAATLAVQAVGNAAMEEPAWVNIAALALSMPRLIVHRLTADAAQQVRSTELRALPGEPPRLLRGAWIVESRRPERHALFGQTVSLGGYWLDNHLYLIGLDYPDGVRVERVSPRWEESDLGAEERESPFVDDPLSQRAWAEQAAEWIITLGALLDAEGTPMEVEDWTEKGRRKSGSGRRSQDDGWMVRRVSLSSAHAGRLVSRTQDGHAIKSLDGLTPVETIVRGHLKRQPYGPGRSERKWIYVEEYEAKRWVSRRPVRIDVDV